MRKKRGEKICLMSEKVGFLNLKELSNPDLRVFSNYHDGWILILANIFL